MYPKARSDNLVIEETDEGVAIYDLERDKVHALNPTASVIFKACDGTKNIAELSRSLHEILSIPADPELALMALNKLDKAHLLEIAIPSAVINRRELLRRLRTTALLTSAVLPAISSIVAPPPAAAQSSTCFVGATQAEICDQCSGGTYPGSGSVPIRLYSNTTGCSGPFSDTSISEVQCTLGGSLVQVLAVECS